MEPQLVAAHKAKAYLKAYKELNKEKIHDSYTKYFAANKTKLRNTNKHTNGATTKDIKRKININNVNSLRH